MWVRNKILLSPSSRICLVTVVADLIDLEYKNQATIPLVVTEDELHFSKPFHNLIWYATVEKPHQFHSKWQTVVKNSLCDFYLSECMKAWYFRATMVQRSQKIRKSLSIGIIQPKKASFSEKQIWSAIAL